MNRFIVKILFYTFILLSISCAFDTHNVIERLDGSSITTEELDTRILELTEYAQVHGLNIAIINNDQTVYKKSFGYRNHPNKSSFSDSTNIYGASLSKAVFGVLVMNLVEEGVLELDVPLQSYLPKRIYEYEPQTRWHDDYRSLKKDSLYHKITARMCLNHTSGFPNWRWFESDQKLRVKFEPGTRYLYSGEGLVYLQVVIEKMMNRSLEDLAVEKIFIPAGMPKSSYQWQPDYEADFAFGHDKSGKTYSKDKDNEPRSASTLETTLNDYSSFVEALLNNKLISRESLNKMFSTQVSIKSLRQFGPQSNIDTTLNDAIQLGYGLGWGVLASPYGVGAFKEGHGDGFQHYSIVFPEPGIGVIIMTNSDNGESIFKELLEVSIGDVYTPWEWQNYIPYDMETK